MEETKDYAEKMVLKAFLRKDVEDLKESNPRQCVGRLLDESIKMTQGKRTPQTRRLFHVPKLVLTKNQKHEVSFENFMKDDSVISKHLMVLTTKGGFEKISTQQFTKGNDFKSDTVRGLAITIFRDDKYTLNMEHSVLNTDNTNVFKTNSDVRFGQIVTEKVKGCELSPEVLNDYFMNFRVVGFTIVFMFEPTDRTQSTMKHDSIYDNGEILPYIENVTVVGVLANKTTAINRVCPRHSVLCPCIFLSLHFLILAYERTPLVHRYFITIRECNDQQTNLSRLPATSTLPTTVSAQDNFLLATIT